MKHKIPRYISKQLVDGEQILEVINLHQDTLISTTRVYVSSRRIFIAKRIIGIITSSLRDISYNQVSSIKLKSSVSAPLLLIGLLVITFGLAYISGLLPSDLLSLNNTVAWVLTISGVLVMLLSIINRHHSLSITIPGGTEPISFSGVKSSLDKLFKIVEENRSL
jgi:hypothetical protein